MFDKDEAIGHLIAANLMDDVIRIMDDMDGKEISDEYKPLLKGALEVISYYSVPSQYETYFASIQDRYETAMGYSDLAPNEFAVTLVKENTDGSANIEIEADTKMKDKFLEEGVNFLLLKGILGGSVEDILRWAERGKQEEKTDEIVKRFNEAVAEVRSK